MSIATKTDKLALLTIDEERFSFDDYRMEIVKLVKVGDDVGLPFSDALVERLGWKIGDTLWASSTPTGIMLTRKRPRRQKL